MSIGGRLGFIWGSSDPTGSVEWEEGDMIFLRKNFCIFFEINIFFC